MGGSLTAQTALLWVVLALLSGCASLMSSAVEDLATDLSAAILENPDVDMVREGAPAFLLLVDGLLKSSPDNPVLLSQAALLNSAYAGAFVTDGERARLMAAKGRSLAERALCLERKSSCGVAVKPFEEFEQWTATLTKADVPLAYGLATAWAAWMQANSDDFNAIADLGKVKLLMSRVAELHESHDHGGPHLYLGVFETLVPPALGGRPEVGRFHFERALALAEGQYLLTQVMFAEQYARLVFDRALHDELLNEVLAAEVDAPGLILLNAVAKQRAQSLLDSADAYF
ncbi:MAG: hypothetical protein F4149_06970 [Gammaproteobacteria bacterium]|nr:hypothetical protein [Gammaproteobacteria bacterium]MYK81384.1 hypothetical protein [Gammaproteobacteria bacterium]